MLLKYFMHSILNKLHTQKKKGLEVYTFVFTFQVYLIFCNYKSDIFKKIYRVYFNDGHLESIFYNIIAILI